MRVDPHTEKVKLFPLPISTGYANLNTTTFDRNGTLWFTGQRGIYGLLVPSTCKLEVFKALRGIGPYGISRTPDGTLYFASLAGSDVGRIDLQTG